MLETDIYFRYSQPTIHVLDASKSVVVVGFFNFLNVLPYNQIYLSVSQSVTL